jgi:orotate phosphoribosyltransferase
MERAELAKKIRDAAFLTGRFKLRSGKISSFYWDKYRFESDPVLLDAVVDEMQKHLPASFDKLAGREMGGIPLSGDGGDSAGHLSFAEDRQAVLVRSQTGEALWHL